MNLFSPILAATDELVYVIAVMILSVAGWVFEKIKRKMADREDAPRDIEPPVRPELQLPRPIIGESPPPTRESQRFPTDVPKPRRERIPPPVPGRRPPTQPAPVARPSKPQAPRVRPPVVRVPQPRVEIENQEGEGPRRAGVAPLPREGQASPAAELIFEALRGARPAEIASPQRIQHVQDVRTISAPVAKVNAHPAQAFRQMSVADWRRAMVLTEVLGPPLALRQSDSQESGSST